MFKPVRKLSKQQTRVLLYLKSGSTLTNNTALNCLGVGSLSSRIAELRHMGFKIDDEMAGPDQFGRSYKKYDLDSSAPEPAYELFGGTKDKSW